MASKGGAGAGADEGGQGDLGLRRGATGRRDNDGTEETIKIPPIKQAAASLMKLYKKLEAARDDFNSDCKAVAERAGINSSTLKKLVKSSATGKFTDVRRDIDQASIVFEQVGEIAGGPEAGK